MPLLNRLLRAGETKLVKRLARYADSIDALEPEVQAVLGLLFSDRVHVTLRSDPLGRGVSAMIILPRGRFSGEVRHRIQEAITRRFQGTVLNYHLAMSAGDPAAVDYAPMTVPISYRGKDGKQYIAVVAVGSGLGGPTPQGPDGKPLNQEAVIAYALPN